MVDIFKTLAEENRLRILALLMKNEMCVCEIIECLKMTQSNVSRHLNTLKKSGIVVNYKKAQWVYYKVDDRFKENHNHLWLYLEEKLKESLIYQKDYDEFENCRREDLCKN